MLAHLVVFFVTGVKTCLYELDMSELPRLRLLPKESLREDVLLWTLDTESYLWKTATRHHI